MLSFTVYTVSSRQGQIIFSMTIVNNNTVRREKFMLASATYERRYLLTKNKVFPSTSDEND